MVHMGSFSLSCNSFLTLQAENMFRELTVGVSLFQGLHCCTKRPVNVLSELISHSPLSSFLFRKQSNEKYCFVFVVPSLPSFSLIHSEMLYKCMHPLPSPKEMLWLTRVVNHVFIAHPAFQSRSQYLNISASAKWLLVPFVVECEVNFKTKTWLLIANIAFWESRREIILIPAVFLSSVCILRIN